jgi:hypothetical protein
MAGQVVGAGEPALAGVLAHAERRVLLRGLEADRRARQRVDSGQALVDRRAQRGPAGQRPLVPFVVDGGSVRQQGLRSLGVTAGVAAPMHGGGLLGDDQREHFGPLAGQAGQPGRGQRADLEAGRPQQAERVVHGGADLRRD